MSYVGIILIIIGIWLILFDFVYGLLYKRNQKALCVKKTFCILIPARNESKVITNLLDSINNQSKKVNMDDVYVIVQKKNDPTIDICKKYKCNVVIRKENCIQRKGYALDEGIKYILSLKKKHDAYFIFDADNVLAKDYFKNMQVSLTKGYDIGIGYRNSKNGNDNVIAACSSLTFSMINEFINKTRNCFDKSLIVSGTGFYVSGRLIDKWQGYPFNTLTEDYELSLYANANNISMTYNVKAVYYDEQPKKFKETIKQRTRWIRGYIDARKKYIRIIRNKMFSESYNKSSALSETLGVHPIIIVIIGVLLLLIKHIKNINYLLLVLFSIYVILLLFTLCMLISEHNKIDLSFKTKIKALFFNPIFLTSYVYCAIKALFIKNLKWEAIEHSVNLKK